MKRFTSLLLAFAMAITLVVSTAQDVSAVSASKTIAVCGVEIPSNFKANYKYVKNAKFYTASFKGKKLYKSDVLMIDFKRVIKHNGKEYRPVVYVADAIGNWTQGYVLYDDTQNGNLVFKKLY